MISSQVADGGMVRVREMTIDDYDAVVEVWARAGLPYRPFGRDAKDRIAIELSGDSAIFLLAEEDGKIVGTALCTHDGRKGWINRLAVDPEHQGKGTGALLVEEAERRFTAKGIKVFACQIMADNIGSQEFFSHLGYVPHDDVRYFSKRSDKDA